LILMQYLTMLSFAGGADVGSFFCGSISPVQTAAGVISNAITR
jgi:hypothetical protein